MFGTENTKSDEVRKVIVRKTFATSNNTESVRDNLRYCKPEFLLCSVIHKWCCECYTVIIQKYVPALSSNKCGKTQENI